MVRMWAVILLCGAFAPKAVAQDFFVPNCKLPFVGKPHDIDHQCGRVGQVDPQLTTAQRKAETAQNRLKNSLCRTGTPKVIALADLAALQVQVDQLPGFTYGNIHTGEHGPPDSRSPLKHRKLADQRVFGEGDLVVFVGFLVEAHYSGQESVDCNASTQADVDLHVALGEESGVHVATNEKAAEKNPKLCKTFSAEVIPHFRPAEWEKSSLDAIGDRKVRVTGQLFFDGSHHPRTCSDIASPRRDPVRASSWEIHPIYNLAICRAGTACNPAHDADWEPVPNALLKDADTEE